jgi:dynein heavy chain
MTDATVAMFKERIMTALQGKMAVDKFNAAYDDETNKVLIQDFCSDVDVKLMMAYMPSGDKVVVTLKIVAKFNNKAVYFLKAGTIKDTVGPEHFESGEITVSEIAGGGGATLENLSLVSHEVIFPLLSNPANRVGWSGPTSKELMLNMSYFLSLLTIAVGDSKEQTVLPYPAPQAFDEDNIPERERVHLLESAVVQWTNKLHVVLNTDPSDAIGKGLNPDPKTELEFWKAKAKDLGALTKQLKDPQIVAVLQKLSQMQSQIAPKFEKLAQDVVAALEESRENLKYLKTLQFYINQLGADLDFPALVDLFPPMFHTLLLVWQNSKTYSIKKRLSTFLQEVSNAIIYQAKTSQNYINGEAIFRFIEDDNTAEAITNLRSCISVCEAFKNSFRHFQLKAAKILAEDAWELNASVVFKRMDAFLLRLSDLTDFVKTVSEFTKLEKVILGGTNGHEQTQSILGTYADFKLCVETLQQVDYDLVDIDNDNFDQDFYNFCCSAKSLERRLSAVLVQAFDEASTMDAKFKLLENFEGLVDRPIIRDAMHLRKLPLIKSYMADLQTVQELFHRHKDKPLIGKNLPPVAGALQWCRSLLVRTEEPIAKLREVISDTKGKDAQEAEDVFAAVTAKLKAYEAEKFALWNQEVRATSDSKLMQALLQRENETRLLSVNFDSALVRLLHEVKYLLLLDLKVDANALAIFEKAEQYRVQIGNLELVVQMYNDMIQTLHMVERPLVEKDISNIDEVLERGIAELNWKSPQVDDFAKEAIEAAKKVYDTVKIMKNNYEETKKMMAEYAKQPLIERKNKPLTPSDYDEVLKKLWVQRHEKIAEHQTKITQLLTETNLALKVNKGSPIWRAYVEYVQDHVRDSLAVTIINSIQFVCAQVDTKANANKPGYVPLLEIKLGLYANDVLFNADDGNSSADEKTTRKGRRDVWQILNDWVEQFFAIGDIMYRMDGSHYVGDLKKNEGVVRIINALKKHLDYNQKECENYRMEFMKYEFLWKSDRNVEFRRFFESSAKSGCSYCRG